MLVNIKDGVINTDEIISAKVSSSDAINKWKLFIQFKEKQSEYFMYEKEDEARADLKKLINELEPTFRKL